MDRTIGILTVHGIGAQESGHTAGGLADGLAARTGGSLVPQEGCAAALRCDGTLLRIYEVHWADYLKGEKVWGSFSWVDFMALACFPLLNLRHGLYREQGVRGWEALLWTPVLVVVGMGLGPIAAVAAVFRSVAGAATAEQDRRRRSPLLQEARARGVFRGIWSMARSAADEGVEVSKRPSKLDRFLDEFAGDVTNYVTSAGGTGVSGSRSDGVAEQLPETLAAAYPGILRAFYDTAAKAEQECDELHIVAHSLGTVASFHALAGFRAREVGADPDAHRITVDSIASLYTIGSPLAKIRFLWPGLVPKTGLLRTRSLPWENFVSRMDLVAGRLAGRYLQWGRVKDRMMWGGGLFRAHTLYTRHPAFLDRLALNVMPGLELRRRGLSQRFLGGLWLVAESLLAPAGLAALMILGLAALLTLPLAFAWGSGVLVGLVAPEAVPAVRSWVAAFFILPMLLTGVISYLKAANDRHRPWRERT